ncbi:MAG: sulfatase [Akkermansiaceae bacterium]|jgi:arylsulfatase A-like enzyme|nr:sulfatase [Akkermansiaceae bacterium]
MKIPIITHLAFTACSLLLAAVEPTPVPHPNIIVLLADDQSWNGLSTRMHPDMPGSRSDYHETPNLEKFAASGMRFSNGYAPAPVCSPTRISLLTGMTPARLGWTKAAPPESGHKLVEGASRKSIRAEETTFPELLRGAGYATAHFGKWHLAGGGPEAHGFDVSDGDTGNHDADPFIDPNPVDIFGMTERAKSFMAARAEEGKPFYLQMSYHALHRPENALKASLARFSAKTPGRIHRDPAVAALSYDLDTGVGRLLDAVATLGLEKNTYVIYMADNGGGGGKGGKGSTDRLHGGKGALWEGGIRVPFIVRGPGIEPGSWCHQPVVGYDWFPTFCRWAGIKDDLPSKLDGGDLTPVLLGRDQPVERHDPALLFHFPHYQGDTPQSAIREGDFKLILSIETRTRKLFDLRHDPAERNDLANERKELADRLESRLRERLKEAGAAMPTVNPDYDPAAAPAPRREGKNKRKP